MSLPSFMSYKDSNVEWLGNVPSHWSVVQTKREFRRRKVLNVGMACEDRLALTMGGVVPRDLDDLDGLQSSDYEAYQIFEGGDLAFKLIDLQNIKTSRVGMVPSRGIMSPAYIRLEPLTPEVGRFGFWYFMALYWTQVFNTLGGGVRQTLGPDELLTVPFPLPPVSEQRAIAIFLDRETAKIDALIEHQQRLMALLDEKRQVVISRAVTKGLDPDVRLKDSGVKWLGQVPEHWSVTTVRRVARAVQTGGTPSDCTPSEVCDGLDWFTPGDFDGDIRLGHAAKKLSHSSNAKVFAANSVLVVGIGATLGKVALAGEECSANQQVNAVIVSETLVPLYVAYALAAMREFMRFVSNSSTIGIMNQEKTKEVPLAIPDEQEQIAVCEHLDQVTRQIGGLKAEARQAIDLLVERRTALILAAVTGKIDVRGVVEEQAQAA